MKHATPEVVAMVAGGAGFVGSHLCDALLGRSVRVICVDDFSTGRHANVDPLFNDPRFRLIDADVSLEIPDFEGPVDVVFNLASPASPVHYQARPVSTMLTNVNGTNNLLQLAKEHGARFVQASTSEVYGDPEVHPQKEAYLGHVNPVGPRACYDEGKRAAEALCYDYLRAGDVDVRVARIFNTYGPRMRADDGRIVSNLIVQALEGQPLTVYGDGSQTRSFCYVTDLVAGLIALMDLEEPPEGPINLGNPDEISVLELARIVAERVSSRSLITLKDLPRDDPRRRKPDITQAMEQLGWSPKVSLAQGLTETIAWFGIPENRMGEPKLIARPAE